MISGKPYNYHDRGILEVEPLYPAGEGYGKDSDED